MKKIYKNIVRTTLGLLAFGLSFSSYGQIASYPYTQDFDAGTSTPTGWSVINNGDANTWEFGTPSGSSDSPYSSPNVAKIDYDSDAHDDYLITPQISVTAGTSDRLRFYGFNYSSFSVDEFYILVSTSGATEADFTDTLAGPIGPPNEWTEYVYDLSAYTTQDIYIAFQAISQNEYYLYLDDITIEANPSCPKVTDITVDAMSDQTVDITWTPGGPESQWSVSWGDPGYTPGDADEVGNDNNVSSTPYQITGLTAETDYDVYVRAVCGAGDTSAWNGPLDVYTGYCTPQATNNSDEIRNFTLNNLNNDSEASEGTDGYADYTDSISPAQLMQSTPYSAQITTGSGSGDHGAAIWIDYNDNLVFEASELVATIPESAIGSATTADFPDFIIPTSVTLGQHRLRVQYTYSEDGSSLDPCSVGTNYSETEDYMVDVLAPPSCPQPQDITVVTSDGQTVDISWTQGGSESTWNISWGPPGYTPGDADEIGNETGWTTGTNYTITGLSSVTEYDIYVQADCGGDQSAWTGLTNYTTPCSAVIAPWTYDVETATETTSSEIEDCWSSTPNNTGSDFRWDVEGSGGGTPSLNTGPDSPYSGDSYFYTEATSGSEEDSAYLTTPAIDLSALTTPALKFYYHMYGGDMGDLLVQVSNDGGLSWSTEHTISGQQQTAESDPWEKQWVSLDTYTGIISIRFVGVRGSAYEGDMSIDDISVMESPTCLEPIDIFIGQVDDTSATVVWTQGDSESSWNIVWGPEGFTPGDADQIGSATSSTEDYTITGLSSGSEYDVYVQADCGSGDESIWAGPVTFSNMYCIPPASGGSSYYIDDVTTVGALTNLNNVGSGQSTDGYGDFTATDTLVVYPGQVIDFSIVSGYSTQKYHVWVDWLQNADFDDTTPNEYIESTSSYSGDHTFTYTIPSVPEMTTRLRVRANGLGSISTACGDNSDSETEDYILKVVAAPSCLPPLNLAEVSATTNGIEIEWDEQNAASSWNIEYGPTGFTPGTGTVVTASTNPYTITGLDPSAGYDFYVQSDCGGGDDSYWSGVLTAYTECGVAVAPFYEGFSSGEQPQCWTNLSSNTSSTDPDNLWRFDAQGEYGSTNNGKPSGTFAKSDGSTPNPDSMLLITPEIDLSALTNPALSFEWFSNNEDNPGDNVPLIVLVTTDSVNYTLLDTLQGDDEDWQFTSYGLNAFAGETIRVVFMTNQAVTSNDAYYNDILLDEVRIDDCINGQPGSIDVCRLDETVNLNDNVVNTPGDGKWYSSPATNGMISNDSMLTISSLPAGSYEVYYSQRAVCYDTTIATINVYGPSSAGEGNTIHACKQAPLNLFSALSGNTDMGGDWYDYNGDLLPNSQPTSPSLEASYNYNYIVSNDVCPADTSTVEVIIDDCFYVGLEEEAFTELSVYPNPASNKINIMNPSNATDLKVKVLDVNGRVVLTDNDAMKNTSKATIAIDQLAKGIYTLRVYSEEGQKVFKIVKQ